MIQPNELRVGNYVIINGNIDRVDSINNNGINLYACGNGDVDFEAFDKLKPIALTPEILEAAGFECDLEDWCGIMINDTVELSINFRLGKMFFSTPYNDGIKMALTAQNIHQLQNLYHSLTGKELEINILNPA